MLPLTYGRPAYAAKADLALHNTLWKQWAGALGPCHCKERALLALQGAQNWKGHCISADLPVSTAPIARWQPGKSGHDRSVVSIAPIARWQPLGGLNCTPLRGGSRRRSQLHPRRWQPPRSKTRSQLHPSEVAAAHLLSAEMHLFCAAVVCRCVRVVTRKNEEQK